MGKKCIIIFNVTLNDSSIDYYRNMWKCNTRYFSSLWLLCEFDDKSFLTLPFFVSPTERCQSEVRVQRGEEVRLPPVHHLSVVSVDLQLNSDL